MSNRLTSDGPSEESLLWANERFYRVFEALDQDGMIDLWEHSDRAFCVHPGWPPLQGAESVLESWRRIIDNTADIRFTLTDVHARVQGRVGIVTLFESVRSEVGEEPHSAGAVSTNLFAFHENDGGWKIFHHHASHTVLPLPPQSSMIN